MTDDRDERPVDLQAFRDLRTSITEDLERLGDRLVEALLIGRDVTTAPHDLRIKLAARLLEGTSYEVAPK